MTPPAYTVDSLAARWGCSAGLVRNMIRRGELATFRLGTLIRISAAEVDRIECQTTPSSASEADSPSSIETLPESVIVNRSSRPIASGQRQKRGNGGGSAVVLTGQWGGR